MKCNTCKSEIKSDCTYNQGRCPHSSPLIKTETPTWKACLFVIIAPFIIGAWCIMNPKKLFEQIKKEWKI